MTEANQTPRGRFDWLS